MVTILRTLGMRIIIYIDDILVMAPSKEIAQQHTDCLIFLLENLGFTINPVGGHPHVSYPICSAEGCRPFGRTVADGHVDNGGGRYAGSHHTGAGTYNAGEDPKVACLARVSFKQAYGGASVKVAAAIHPRLTDLATCTLQHKGSDLFGESFLEEVQDRSKSAKTLDDVFPLDPQAQAERQESGGRRDFVPSKRRFLGRSPTSSNAAALIFRVSILFFEAKSHLHFVFAFTQQR